MWSEHKPSAQEENEYIERYNFDEFGKWYLGVDTDEKEDTKGRYKFPYSDFAKVHRCGVLAAENRAGQYKYNDIEQGAAHLHGMIDASSIESHRSIICLPKNGNTMGHCYTIKRSFVCVYILVVIAMAVVIIIEAP